MAGISTQTARTSERDFLSRVGRFEKVMKVTLTAAQVTAYDLPPQMGKATDPRASQFVARYGRLVQVELDALPPDTLRGLYQSALDPFVDMSTFEAVVDREAVERDSL